MRVGEIEVGYVKKKLALFVAWALLATGVVMGSSSPASALEGVQFPFENPVFGGYANGAGVHVGALQTAAPPDATRVVDLDLGFSGASVNSTGLTGPVFNEYDFAVQPTASEALDTSGAANNDPADAVEDDVAGLADQEAYGKGSGVELGLGSTLPDEERDLVLAGLAEGASHPAVRSDGDPPLTEFDTGVVRESIDVPADPLLFVRAASGEARANYNPQFCVPGAIPPTPTPNTDDLSANRLGWGRGSVALAQVLNTGDFDEDTGMSAPVLQVRAPGPDRAAVDTKSFTYLVPNGDPNEPDTTYGVVSETRGTIAPISIGPNDPVFGFPTLTIEVVGEWILRAHATGLGDATITQVLPSLVRIIQPPEPTDPNFPGPVVTEVIPTPGAGDIIPGVLALGEEPRAIGADPGTPPTTTRTEGSAAADVIRVTLPPGVPSGQRLVDVRLGHQEVQAIVPDGGINCPGQVEILKDFSEDPLIDPNDPDAGRLDFPFVIRCTDPADNRTVDINPDPAETSSTVIVPGAPPQPDPSPPLADQPDPFPDSSAVSGPIPSGAVCEVNERPPPGWRSTQTSADPAIIVTNQLSQVRFFNEPRPAGPGTLVIEKFVPADRPEMQEFTYEFSIECENPDRTVLDINLDPGTGGAERRIRPADLPANEDADPDTAPNPDPSPTYGDTRGTGSFNRPVTDLPDGTICTVTEEDDPNFIADPNDPRFDPTADPVFVSQPPRTVIIRGEAENVVQFSNDPAPPGFGNLIVVKDAPDDETAQNTNFDFSVTCPDGVRNEAFDRDVVGDGQSAPVVGIAEGTVCTVHEDVPPGFEVDQNDQQVTIVQNTTHRVTFVNSRPNATGTLVVTKDAPDDAQDIEFDFSVDCPTFFAQPVDVKVTGDGSSDGLAVPPGTECRVHEFTEPGFVSQPDVTVTVQDPSVVTEAIFINQRVTPGVGSLTVTKDAPADAQNVIFTFSISCPDLFNEPFARSVVGDATSEPVVGIPAGITCRISEATQDGFLPQPDQQILIADGANGVTFVNTRGTPIVGGVSFNRQPAAPAVAANAQPRYTG